MFSFFLHWRLPYIILVTIQSFVCQQMRYIWKIWSNLEFKNKNTWRLFIHCLAEAFTILNVYHPTEFVRFLLSDFSVYAKLFCYRIGQLATNLQISMKCTTPLCNRYLQIHIMPSFTVHCETLIFIPLPNFTVYKCELKGFYLAWYTDVNFSPATLSLLCKGIQDEYVTFWIIKKQ